MTQGAPDRLERLFRAARLHPPGEQAAFLAAACPDDDALRAEVAALLAADADADAGDFLGQPATGLLDDLPPPPPTPDPLVGCTLGPYRVLRLLGEGGMGAVYLAVREVPFVRYVALKVVRGLASPDAVARFEQERQILAGMDHPGIARLLDGGVTDPMPGAPAGLPYFAMEYVEGRPLTDYADDHRLSVDERLALFQQACEAVHVAHQNLVLHRDLKPSNILVTADGGPDGGPRVKLLDFGIAKLLHPTLGAAAAPVTRTSLRPLTPEYASPEQVRGDPLTTASDVYALGVVLYELLTGERPYRLDRRTPDAVARAVTDADPERPSMRVGRVAADVARRRDTVPEKLRRALRGDLDTIVLKALRKEPGRRYASAEALAADLGRHREGLPVLARGDAAGYRVATFVRRHRAATAVAGVAFGAAVGLAVYLQAQAGRLEAERDRARAAQAEADAVAAFLVGLFERADPTAAPGDSVTVGALLDGGAARVETELADQPAVQASVLAAVAGAYQNFGRPADALPLLERAAALRRRALGPHHPHTAASQLELADALAASHAVGRAEALYRAHLAASERAHGPQSAEVATALSRLVPLLTVLGRDAEAAPLARRWQALLDGLADDAPGLADNLTTLAAQLGRERRFAEAEAYLRRALRAGARADGDTSVTVARALLGLASVQRYAGRLDAAAATARRAGALHRVLYPNGDDGLAASLDIEAEAARARSRPDRALALYREALAVRRRVHPEGYPTIAVTYFQIGDLAAAAGRRAEAASAYRSALAAYEAMFGPEAPQAREVRAALAALDR